MRAIAEAPVPAPNGVLGPPQWKRSADDPDGLALNIPNGNPVAKRRRSMPQPKRVSNGNTSPVTAKPEKPAWRKSFPHRPYHCLLAPYGCASAFSSKNEWKRHISTQHMRLGFWRCDQCPNREHKPNDFNRKDLFTQHLRRMHPLSQQANAQTSATGYDDSEERELAAAAERCYIRLRSLPEGTNCVFCGQVFEGSESWNSNLEHVAKHMEQSEPEEVSPKGWTKDGALENWLVDEDMLEADKDRWVLRDSASDTVTRARAAPRVRSNSMKQNAAEKPRRPTIQIRPVVAAAPNNDSPIQHPQSASGRITRKNDYRNGLSDDSLQALGLRRTSDQRQEREEPTHDYVETVVSRPSEIEIESVEESESEIDEQSDELLSRIAAISDYETQPTQGTLPNHSPKSPVPEQPLQIPPTPETVESLVADMDRRVRSMLWWTDSALFTSQWRSANVLMDALRARGRGFNTAPTTPSQPQYQWHTHLPSPFPTDLCRRCANQTSGGRVHFRANSAHNNVVAEGTAGESNGVRLTNELLENVQGQPLELDSQLQQHVSSLREQIVILEQRLNQPQRQNAVESTLGMVWGQLVRRGDSETWPNALLYNLVQSVTPNIIASAAVSLPQPAPVSGVEEHSNRTATVSKQNGMADETAELQHTRMDSARGSAG